MEQIGVVRAAFPYSARGEDDQEIDGYERFPSKLNATRVTWEQIAEAVFSPLVLDDKE